MPKQETDQSTLNETEIMGLFDSRASMYGLLAGLYREELEFDRLQELKRMRFPVGTGNESIDQGFRDLHEYLKTAWEGSVTELKVDFSRTFIGSGVSGYSAAYPYESVYTSERRLLAREARGEVLQYYRNNNLKKGRWNDLEDHIALELEFMQIMSARTRDAHRNGDEGRHPQPHSLPVRFHTKPCEQLASHDDRRCAQVLRDEVLSGGCHDHAGILRRR